jgi:hypothetical protein
MIQIVWHFLKRVLKYDAFLSGMTLAGALVMNGQALQSHRGDCLTFAAGVLVRFVLIACTAGYALSVFIYGQLQRNELPLYMNAGFRIGTIAAVSWCCLSAGLLFVTAAFLLAIRWLTA